MQLQFLGANQQVTGSSYLLEVAGKRIMIDHGMFQERRYQERNWEPCPVSPKSVDVLLLTHAHLDHCGLIPKLVRDGFNGRIVTTEPSVELAQLVMNDSARIQEEDIKYKQKRHRKEGRKSRYPYEPLYTIEDAQRVEKRFNPTGFDTPVSLSGDLSVTYRRAGHILGAATLEIEAKHNGSTKRIVFSGDVGQDDMPIVPDPQPVDAADYVVMESTYGDRDHKDAGNVQDKLADVINDTVKRGGNIVIPTFAIERAQELILHLTELKLAGRIPLLPTFLDSPMAANATEIFLRHPDYMDAEMRGQLSRGRFSNAWHNVHLVRTVDGSKSINTIRGSAIIMAGSGMCTGGRIKHHLVANIGRKESTILFVGYQSVGTLGRRIRDGELKVRIFGVPRDVLAKIESIDGFSAHGDREDLLRWIGTVNQPRRVFLTHGDKQAADNLADEITQQHGYDTHVPAYLERVTLD